MSPSNIFQFSGRVDDVVLAASSRNRTVPIHVATSARDVPDLTKFETTWIDAKGFAFGAGAHVVVPNEDGRVARVICGASRGKDGLLSKSPAPASYFVFARLATRLPEGDYHIASDLVDGAQAVLAWVLGSYAFDRYKSGKARAIRRLKVGKEIDADAVLGVARGSFLGRDLINTPANDLGPDELEDAARALGKSHKAKCDVTKGDALLQKNFPMIHAVGRASDREPRLVDLTWGDKKHPRVTLVGKGIVFDTGGLNLKPGASMTLMKKDMGGAATALALASMIMDAKLPVRLRVLLPIAENSVSANAYRPGDVLDSRNGKTVEIGNTDAEGRLVLADALTLGDEEAPDMMFCFATLTGAARVALGPDLPPYYATDDKTAAAVLEAGTAIHDPLWRMPFWAPYAAMLKSNIADINHITSNGFAGSVTAALFLKSFVTKCEDFSHIDLFGWVPMAKDGFPKGGDPQSARAVFEALKRRFA